MERRRYLILGHQRSGTTLVHSILKGHPRVAALNDELRIGPLFTRGVSTFTFGNDAREEIEAGYCTLFDAITSIRAKRKQALAHGAKVTCGSPDVARLLVGSLQEHFRDLRIIHVVRRDLVAQCGSEESLRRTGVAHSWSPEYGRKQVSTLSINKWVFTRYAVRCLRTQQVLRDLYRSHTVLDVVYEDYLADPGAVHERLFEFLDVPNVEVTWLEARKLMPAPDRYIRNYEQLRGVLRQLQNGGAPSPGSLLVAEAAHFIDRVRWLAVSPDKLRRRLARIGRPST